MRQFGDQLQKQRSSAQVLLDDAIWGTLDLSRSVTGSQFGALMLHALLVYAITRRQALPLHAAASLAADRRHEFLMFEVAFCMSQSVAVAHQFRPRNHLRAPAHAHLPALRGSARSRAHSVRLRCTGGGAGGGSHSQEVQQRGEQPARGAAVLHRPAGTAVLSPCMCTPQPAPRNHPSPPVPGIVGRM